jgi:hypothetical protein
MPADHTISRNLGWFRRCALQQLLNGLGAERTLLQDGGIAGGGVGRGEVGERDRRGGGRRIVIANRKGRKKARRLLNADDLAAGLRKWWRAEKLQEGGSASAAGELQEPAVEVVHFEELSLREVAVLLDTTALLAAPHGATLVNMLYMRPGAAVLEMIPYRCQRLKPYYSSLAERLALQYFSYQVCVRA